MNFPKSFNEMLREGQMILTKDAEEFVQLRFFAQKNIDVIKNYMFKEDVKKVYITSFNITDSDDRVFSYVACVSNSTISDLKVIPKPMLFLEINHMIREDIELDYAAEAGRFRDLSDQTLLFFMNVQDTFIKKRLTLMHQILNSIFFFLRGMTSSLG